MISSDSEEESRYDFHEGTDEEEDEDEDESCSQTNVVEINIDESNEDESNENNEEEEEEETTEPTDGETKRLNRLNDYFCGWSLPETNDSMLHHYFRKMKGDPKVKNTTR